MIGKGIHTIGPIDLFAVDFVLSNHCAHLDKVMESSL